MIFAFDLPKLGFVGGDWLDFDFTLADLSFSWFFAPTPPTVNGERVGSFSYFPLPKWSNRSRMSVNRWAVLSSHKISVSFKRLYTKSWLSIACFSQACVLKTWVRFTFFFRTSRGFRSSWVIGVFTAFEKISSGLDWVRSFRMACVLGTRSFVYILILFWFFLAVPWEGLVVCLTVVSFDFGTGTLLCPLLLHLAFAAIASYCAHIWVISCSPLVFHIIRETSFLFVIPGFLWTSVVVFLWKSVGVVLK